MLNSPKKGLNPRHSAKNWQASRIFDCDNCSEQLCLLLLDQQVPEIKFFGPRWNNFYKVIFFNSGLSFEFLGFMHFKDKLRLNLKLSVLAQLSRVVFSLSAIVCPECQIYPWICSHNGLIILKKLLGTIYLCSDDNYRRYM